MVTPFDLHVLSAPPAFILSQDQTLEIKSLASPRSAKLQVCASRKLAGCGSASSIRFQDELGSLVFRILWICSFVVLNNSLRIFRVALLFACQGADAVRYHNRADALHTA